MRSIVLLIISFLVIWPTHGASSAQAKELKFEKEILVKIPKTDCEILFKHMAIVAMFCNEKTNPKDLLSDLYAIESKTNWQIPVFEIFTDKKKAPKTISSYNSLPDKVPFQKYTIQIKEGKVIEKQCYKNAKNIACDF